MVSQDVPSSKVSVDLQAIDNRLEQLKNASLQSSYSKQKCSLRLVFETFLASLPNSKTILSASPIDITRFLVWKDRYCNTVLHKNGCPDSHLQSATKCECPKRLAFKTIDSYIGKLRAIFKEIGCCGEWNSMLGLGNPAASLEVQKYLRASTEEQLCACISPKQAVPLFLLELLLLAHFWSRKIEEHWIYSSGLFVLVQGQAFFKVLLFSGDCGSDLGMVRTEEILRFPQDEGLLFNHVWGKTLRDGTSNVFGIRRHPNPELCPVKAIETYVAVASELRVSVTNSYLFRPTNPQAHIVNKPFTSSSAEACLKLYLREARIDEGETPHRFCSGSAITLALSGSQLADIIGSLSNDDGDGNDNAAKQ